MKRPPQQPVDGPHKELFTDGKLSAAGSYKAGKRHGKWTFYYRSGGKKAAGKYVAGQLDGPWTWWRESGSRLQVGSFKLNTQIGTWKRFHENGELWDETVFVDGKKGKRKKGLK